MYKLILTFFVLFLSLVLEAQIKVLSNGNTGFGTLNPARKIQIGNTYNDNFSSYMRIRSWWHNDITKDSYKGHPRIEFNDKNFGIGTGDINYGGGYKDRMYFYTYTKRGFDFYFTDNGESHPGEWVQAMTIQEKEEIDGSYGVVGINKPDPSYSLDVGGYVRGWNVYVNSDKRLKRDIKNIDSCLFKLKKITGKKYKLKSDIKQLNSKTYFVNDSLITSKEDNKQVKIDENHFGLIAQEIQKVYPELVSEDGDGMLSIDYNGFIPIIIEALKEQQDEIERLKSSTSNFKSASTFEDTNSISSFKNRAVLYQNAPNPFNNNTKIQFQISEKFQEAYIYLYDMQGVQISAYEIYDNSESSITISAADLNPGMYLYSLIVNSKEIDTKRMILTD